MSIISLSSYDVPGEENPVEKNISWSSNTKLQKQKGRCLQWCCSLWESMVHTPFPYLVVIPIVYAVLIGLGWFTKGDIVEDEVIKLWLPTGNAFYKDYQYALDLKNVSEITMTTLAALALSRDGSNIFTSDRLEKVRSRMEQTEKTNVTYKNITYTWDDLCALNPAPYELPCARLTPMDYFYEARWYFEKEGNVARLYWYNQFITNGLKLPTFSRYHILMTKCTPQQDTNVCAELLQYRTNKTNTSIALLGDVRKLELSDDCRICIETSYQTTIIDLYKILQSSFNTLKNEIQRYLTEQQTNIPRQLESKLSTITLKLDSLLKSITSDDIEEFYFYYSVRYAYAELGYKGYTELYNTQLSILFNGCPLLNLSYCPPINVSIDEAKQALFNHADNTFSNKTTSGAPFPMWGGTDDGAGNLFDGSRPVSGSGINMSSSINSLVDYLDANNYVSSRGSDMDNRNSSSWVPFYGADGYVGINSANWKDMVKTNPLYAWFMASLETADQYYGCGNGYLTGTNSTRKEVDELTKEILINSTMKWCNEYSIPNSENRGHGNYTKQYFAKMWYDLLLDSPNILDLKKGYDDPYSWTTGAGCDYTLGGSRTNYTNITDKSILYNASHQLYFYDEGVFLGAVSAELLMGGVRPPIGNFSFANPLQKVSAVQTMYAALIPDHIINRVQHCKRPGGPVYNLTREDATEILYLFKEATELTWTKGWNDPKEDVQFVAFFDDAHAAGTMQRLLREITMDNTTLTAISIALIALFSVLCLFSFDCVESRVLIALVAVTLVILGYYAAVGFAILVGIKINITIAWTLPFIILGIGVDDMYIVLMNIKQQKSCGEEDFFKAMNEVVVPVTMTAAVNASMFAIMTLSDIPAIYLTSRVAVYCVISLYLSVIFCFPAYCYMDMKRQAANRCDVFFCFKRQKYMTSIDCSTHDTSDFRSILLYDKIFKPLVLSENRRIRTFSYVIIMSIAITLLGLGLWGITERKVGMGLEELFPSSHQAKIWAQERTKELASWNIDIRWGHNNYTDPNIQMQMMKQFEDIVATNYVAEIDTKRLWIAEFALWASRLCEANVGRSEFDQLKCGRDQVFNGDSSNCDATWKINSYGLKQKLFSDYNDQTCHVYEGGVCRPITRMHPDDIKDIMISNPTIYVTDSTSFCPTIDNWSDEKWQFCLLQWRNLTGSTNGNFKVDGNKGSKTECDGVYRNDLPVTWPIKYASGPTMYAYNLISHEETLKMMEETRQYCDNHETIHCWMQGAPFMFWTQYETIEKVLLELCIYSTSIGFLISFLFLYGNLAFEGSRTRKGIFCGSLIGASFITVTCVLSLIAVVGLSALAGVGLTAFSNMSFVLSVGFSVEYSVHIMARWLKSDLSEKTDLDRVRHIMSFLMMPLFMSFASSLLGVICLAFTQFQFIDIFYFRPLIIVMFVTWFYGCWWLPSVLTTFSLFSSTGLDDGRADESR